MIRPTAEDLAAFPKTSILLHRRRAVIGAWREHSLRALRGVEIERLEAQGNSAADWGGVRVVEDFATGAIHGCRFEGRLELGLFAGEAGDPSSPGLFYCTIRDCTVAGGARIDRCDLAADYFIAPGALVQGVGRLAMTGGECRYGNGLILFDEPHYQRRLRAVAELPFDWAAWVTSPEAAGPEHRETVAAMTERAERYADLVSLDRGYVGPGASVRATAVIEDAWIGEGAAIDGASAVRNSTVWGTAEEATEIRDGAVVRDALIGPGCRLANLATVERSILFEHVEVDHQAIVKGSAVGAAARLSETEVNDSLLGPMVTAMHHSLVIAAWWPEGRGNVAYGANVGSNHTGRAPDQEIWPGEGVFFGLGSSIKFPANYREAPYTIIATGAVTLPQRVTFPFSLINTPGVSHPGVSPALNEIRPGWGLLHNAYGIERQERNFAERHRGRRTAIDPAVFRPDVIELMDAARRELEAMGSPKGPVFTGGDFPGLGKNYMTDEARLDGIEAYTLGRRVGGARYLFRALEAEDGPGAERVARASELLGVSGAEPIVDAALEAEAAWLEAMVAARLRDARRGERIHEDYGARHLPVESDPVILAARGDLAVRRDRREPTIELIRRLTLE